MKHLTFKSLVHVLLLSAILVTAVVVTSRTYKNLKQVCNAQPAGAGAAGIFDMID